MRSMDTRDAEKVLREIRELMHELGVIFFLRHGTCLGAVRDGELIPWDDDLDIGSIIGMNDLDERSINKAVDRFREAEFRVRVLKTDFHIGVELSKFEIPIDWTCYRVLGGNIFQYPAVKIPIQLYDDLKPITLIGETFLVPNPPEEYLTLKYGPEWRVPKKMDFESDIIDSIPESVILERSGIIPRISKLLFPSRHITKIRVLAPDGIPMEMTEVSVVGVSQHQTDRQGYAKFDLLREDYYAVVIGQGEEREILYEEILKPGSSYCYLRDPNQISGRIHALKEES